MLILLVRWQRGEVRTCGCSSSQRLVALALVAVVAPPATASSGTLVITSDTTLTEDHQGNIVIEADNVTLDCAGHTVQGTGYARFSGAIWHPDRAHRRRPSGAAAVVGLDGGIGIFARERVEQPVPQQRGGQQQHRGQLPAHESSTNRWRQRNLMESNGRLRGFVLHNPSPNNRLIDNEARSNATFGFLVALHRETGLREIAPTRIRTERLSRPRVGSHDDDQQRGCRQPRRHLSWISFRTASRATRPSRTTLVSMLAQSLTGTCSATTPPGETASAFRLSAAPTQTPSRATPPTAIAVKASRSSTQPTTCIEREPRRTENGGIRDRACRLRRQTRTSVEGNTAEQQQP